MYKHVVAEYGRVLTVFGTFGISFRDFRWPEREVLEKLYNAIRQDSSWPTIAASIDSNSEIQR